MANQKQSLTLPRPRRYTRTDFAALRAFVQRIAPAVIARRYYDAEDPQQLPHAATPEAMAKYLRAMRDALVRLAILNGSPVLADHPKVSIRQHGSAKLTAVTLRMVEQAAQLGAAVPAPEHPVGFWFRPLVAQRLAGEGIATLQALIGYCNARGGSWWRSVPRIGPLRARMLVAWLRRHEATLGDRVDVDAGPVDWPLAPEPGDEPGRAVVIAGPPEAPRLAPFERLAVPAALSGGEGAHGTGKRGTNRAGAFASIRAPHDLAAFHAWLHRYRDRPATCRAYTRELERFVLWSVIVRGVAVPSATVEDCEAYFRVRLSDGRTVWRISRLGVHSTRHNQRHFRNAYKDFPFLARSVHSFIFAIPTFIKVGRALNGETDCAPISGLAGALSLPRPGPG